MIKVNLKELKELDQDLLKKIINQIGEEDVDDVMVEVDNKRYGFSCIEQGSWEDDGRGKYFSKESTYILGLYGEDENRWEFIEKYNVIVYQNISRTGSYYTDWYYEYGEPSYNYAYEKTIPEQIIPAHTVVEFKPLVIH